MRLQDFFDSLQYRNYIFSEIIINEKIEIFYDLLPALELFESQSYIRAFNEFNKLENRSKLYNRIKYFYLLLCKSQLIINENEINNIVANFNKLHQNYGCMASLFEIGQLLAASNPDEALKYFALYYDNNLNMLRNLDFSGTYQQTLVFIECYSKFVAEKPDFIDPQKIGINDISAQESHFDFSDYLMFNPYPHDNKVGDSYILASLLKYIKDKFQKKIIVFTQTNKIPIFKFYDYIDAVLPMESYQNIVWQLPKSNKFKIGSVFHYHYGFAHISNTPSPYLSDFLARKLGLKDINFVAPYQSNLAMKINACKMLHQLNLTKNKTIIFNKYSNTIKLKILGDDFWINLAIQCQNLGYEVVFNDSQAFLDFKTCFVPYQYLAEFAELCGCLITVRTGICDIIANQNPDGKMIIIMNNQQQFPMGYFSLKLMYNNQNILECHENNIDELHQQIFEYLDNNFALGNKKNT